MHKESDVLDSFLVVDYLNGNQRSMALLVKRWHAKFCHLAYWYTKDYEAAQDIVQDSWQVIIRKIDRLKDPAAFKSWATRIVINKAMDWFRKKSKGPIKLSDDTIAEPTVETVTDDNRDVIGITKKAIMSLPTEQQEVLRMFYTEDYNLREIASILNISPGTVKSRLFYARERLKQILKKHIS